MADLNSLLQKQKELQAEIDKARKEARRGIKQKINALLKDASLTIQDVFPELVGGAAPKKAKAAAKPRKAKAASKKRQAGTPKYVVDGKPVDGRAARRDPAFDSVRTDGKIDDTKSQAAGMINPVWIAEQQKSVLKKLGIKGS